MTPPRPLDPAPGLHDLRRIALWSHYLLVGQAVLAAAAVIAAIQYGPGFDDEHGSPFYALIALAQLLAYVVGAFFVLRWIYLASDNVHRMGAQQLGPSPGWAIGWFFIPFANLVMPFQAMRETWKASVDPRDWEVVPVSPILGAWWGCWLLSNFLGIIGFRLATEASFGDVGRLAEQFGIASDLLFIPACLLMAAIIGRVTPLQTRADATFVRN